MKLSSVFRNKYIGDYHNYINKKQGNQTIQEFFFDKKINFTMGTEGSAERLSFYSEHSLRVGAEIRNVKDSRGINIFPEGYYSITNAQPIVNVFNNISGYKYRAIRILE
jgi:hypothetical protein